MNLAGTPVADSAISNVEGLEGRLTYRGIDIRELAEASSFEEVVYLLWHGSLPSQSQLNGFMEKLVAERGLPEEVLAAVELFPKSAPPIEVARTGVSMLAMFDPDRGSNAPEATLRKAIRLTAKLPSIVAAFHRCRQGLVPLAPGDSPGLAADFLQMLSGKEPDDVSRRTLDICLIAHADHEFNSSAFAARVTASTQADLYGAVTSAIAALAGPMHSGAGERVVEMLEAIGEDGSAEQWIRAALGRRERIHGFGHMVYKTEDPRATILREVSRSLGERVGDLRLHRVCRKVEEAMLVQRQLYPNVDFYSGLCYRALGIPNDLFGTIFAVSRMGGWVAHVLEQYEDGRLARPRSRDVGPAHTSYVPIQER
ncbi:MAG: citrate synthase [Chloroflexi bacterium]|nr:citrate synthase [Chloroflexota bacterium]